jgi:hypothetical protein
MKKFIPINNFLEPAKANKINEKSNFAPRFIDWNKIHSKSVNNKEIKSIDFEIHALSFDEII